MTNKSEKNNVDDYYKKVASKTDKSSEKKPAIKKSFKVKAKKKIVPKKDKNQEPKTAEQIQANVDRRVANINKKFANTDSGQPEEKKSGHFSANKNSNNS